MMVLWLKYGRRSLMVLFLFGMGAGLFGIASLAMESEESASPAEETLEDFQIIINQNIFSPSRTGSREEEPEPEPEPEIEEVLLVGTLITDTGAYAFFEGSRTEFNMAAELNGTIAGGTVSEIRSNQVTLQLNNQPLILKVGNQLVREDGGEWKISTESKRPVSPPRNVVLDKRETSGEETRAGNRGESREGFRRDSRGEFRRGSRGESRDESSQSTDAPAENDMLRQLMERRERERRELER